MANETNKQLKVYEKLEAQVEIDLPVPLIFKLKELSLEFDTDLKGVVTRLLEEKAEEYLDLFANNLPPIDNTSEDDTAVNKKEER